LIESIPNHSVTLLDKGFFSADLLLSIQDVEKNRHWMIPERKGTVRTELEHCGDGDYLVQMNVSPQARKKNPALPEYWQVGGDLRSRRKRENGLHLASGLNI
ncbi:Transposase, partial [Pseudomonas avellanae]